MASWVMVSPRIGMRTMDVVDDGLLDVQLGKGLRD